MFTLVLACREAVYMYLFKPQIPITREQSTAQSRTKGEMKQLTAILALLTAVILCDCSRDSQVITGIKIYEYDKDFQTLASKWKETGINTAFVSKELAVNEAFRKVLKEAHIKVFVVFPVYYNPEALKNDTTLYAITEKGTRAKDDWVEFVCPSRKSYNDSKIAEAAQIVKTLRPDGISIDFIREFVFWEMIYPDRSPESIGEACFCDSCVTGFTKTYKIMLPDSCRSVSQKANYIKTGFASAWNDYRTGLIASMVKEISDTVRSLKQDIKVNVHIVPWRDSDFDGANIRIAGQDVNKIAPYADYLSPMCYSQMLKRDPDWIASVVSELDKKAPGKVLPSIQVYPYYIDNRFTPDDFGRCVEAALKAPSKGVVYFSWPLFEKDPARLKTVKERIRH